MRIWLALGTNLGNRFWNLRDAQNRLSGQINILGASSIYETAPWGVTDQPDFLNQVIEAETDLQPRELLGFAKQIEKEMGRVPTVRYGPRLIDIDILLYDDEQVDQPDLVIPHPRMAERAFVMVPLAELSPDKMLPGTERTASQILQTLNTESVRRIPHQNPYLEYGRRTYIMGIINVTPDSFSGDGLLSQPQLIQAALEQAERFVEAGADILDIGGESTRPGASAVSDEEEMERVIPVVDALAASGLNALLSIDTYKAKVANSALKAGAHWINDIWGLFGDERMAGVAAEAQCPVILMHNRLKSASAQVQANLGGRYVGAHYENLIEEIKQELLDCVALGEKAGIRREQIILDPGIGFGKTVEQNLELVRRMAEIKALGYPLLVGPSRKSFIGYTLDLPPQQRLEGTAAVCALSIDRGADILRVHDVEEIVRVARMTDAVVRK